MKLYANLHTHTTHSDGIYSPAELVSVAKKEGYKAVAVTDHDVITGYPELKAECEKEGLDTIFGTEFSSPFAALNTTYHMTAFNFDPEHPRMKSYLEERSYCQTYKAKVLFDRGIKEGLIGGITWEEILEYNKSITWLCNEHVFRAMKAKGLKTDTDYPEFFRTVYGDRRREVVEPYPFMEGEDIIKLVHDAGGIIMIAHPEEPYGRISDIPELVRMGADGVEVWHGLLFNEARHAALEMALKYDLFVSGGSDHEGLCGGQYARYEDPTKTRFYKPELSLGTTKEFYEEIKRSKKSDGRKEYIKELLQMETL